MDRRGKRKKAKTDAKRSPARKPTKDDSAKAPDLKQRLAEALSREAEASKREAEALGKLQTRDRELAEAQEQLTAAHAQVRESHEQQTATSEILRVISSSPTELQPVLDTLVKSAARFCAADDALIHRLEGDGLQVVAAHHGPIPTPAGFVTPVHGTASGRSVLERRAVHVADIAAEAEMFPEGSAIARALGFRTMLSVPLLREGVPLGTIVLRRSAVEPFSEKQIALLQTCADQAVIAIENARLLTELQQRNEALTQAHAQVSEALEQQTATAEILSVISGSPTDIRPVFDAVLDRALTLCEASNGSLYQLEDGALRHVALRGPHLGIEVGGVFPLVSSPGRAVLEKRTVHLEDILQELDWHAPEIHAGIRRTGIRTIVAVPLLREQTAIGAIIIRRLEVRPFSEKQIRLLQTFADQAVIAIENVRLFKELEARNRDLTATGEILRVISTSPTDVKPVFDTIVESALRLLRGYSAGLTRVEGDQLVLCALTSTDDVGDAAVRAGFPRPVNEHGAIRDRAPGKIADTHTDPRWPGSRRPIARARGYHSLIEVPLLRQGEAIGGISVTRREPGGFSDDEIAVLKTFADQAVIAIENVRLFTETKEALERQTATSEILRVISSSPTDAQPVFEAIARNAARLCDASRSSVNLLDGEWIRFVARYNLPEGWTQIHVADAPNATRVIRDGVIFHVADAETDTRVTPEALSRIRALESRSFLMVPLHQEITPIGSIVVYRSEAGSFSDQQIELLQTFADQAVIAIENVRLFKELETSNRDLTTALDKQTATSEILQVISQSQTDVQPVFDAIVASAARLLGGYTGTLTRIAGDQLVLAAVTSTDAAGDAAVRALFPRPLNAEGSHTETVRGRAPVNVSDVLTDHRMGETIRAYASVRGFRSQVTVPMLRHDEVIGTIAVTRREPGGCTDDEISLLRTFADQAVIAIENVRLFKELEARNRDLTVALDQQTATSDILRVISRSQTDVQPVFDAIVT